VWDRTDRWRGEVRSSHCGRMQLPREESGFFPTAVAVLDGEAGSTVSHRAGSSKRSDLRSHVTVR
jgi:hypothetical protein